MKEYKGCKYYELEEITDGCLCFPSGVTIPYVVVLIYFSDHSVPVPLRSDLTIEELFKAENPEELLETVSKEAIDRFVEERNKRNES